MRGARAGSSPRARPRAPQSHVEPVYSSGYSSPTASEIRDAEVAHAGRVQVADVLADNPDMKPDEVQAIGFALVAWLRSPGLSRAFPRFAAGVLKDPSNLDGLLNDIYKTNREQFLTGSGEWVAERFGNSLALPADDFSE